MPSVSIVIPAYNERRRLPGSLRAIGRYLAEADFSPVEILVIDDGSSDGTPDLAEAARPSLEESGTVLRVLCNHPNRGKGYSVRRGMAESTHEWVLFSDADLSTPIEELGHLHGVAVAGGHDVAIGSRNLDCSLIGVRQPLRREVAGRAFNLAVKSLTSLCFRDTQCGFKLFSRRASRQIAALQRIERFGFDVEMLYLARKLGLSVVEVPVRWNDDPESSVGTIDGLRAFLDVWSVKWNDVMGRYD